MTSTRSKLTTIAAVVAVAVSSAAIATAATSGTTSTTSSTSTPAPPMGGGPGQPHDPSKGGHTVNGKTETLLTGDVEAKVRAAALTKVPGTVERVETNVDSSAPYEAHIVKSDGTEVEVQVGGDYTVSAVNTMGARQHP